MKPFGKFHGILLCFLLFFNTVKAQYVTIPDTAFVSWLNNHGFAGCMVGNQMDTTCSAILDSTTLNCYAVPIRDLTGIQYFKNLTTLDCSNDSVYSIPALPSTVKFLNCRYNNLDSLPVLPTFLLTLTCDFNQLLRLPALPPTLLFLYANNNNITSLPVLPSNLDTLVCSSNRLLTLPLLPASLQFLDCFYNQINTLPILPSSLQALFCGYNQLTALPTLPAALIRLWCYNNQITNLPNLPSNLYDLDCSFNPIANLPGLPLTLVSLRCHSDQLTSLPVLPNGLGVLSCGTNQLTSLPSLPPNLTDLFCGYNQLSNLPTLPLTLDYLLCYNNRIITLPNLPPRLRVIECQWNQLTTIPILPDTLTFFYCHGNPNLFCLPELKRIINLYFDGTVITCLPNYGNVTNSTPALSAVPLCGIFNPGGCGVYWNVSGNVFYDVDANCIFDSTDAEQGYVKMQLDSSGVLLQQVFTGGVGDYSFLASGYGSYTIQPDTLNLPFTLSCPDSGYLATTISAVDSLSYSNNFAFKCRTQGFDIGVQSVLNYAVPRPASEITINTVAGDISELYGAHCASGISGQVQITYSGSITYNGPAQGALTPTSVSGNTVTWKIADFGTVNDRTAFNLVFQVNANAIAGSLVCFTVNVTPTIGDYNPANNTLSYCFPIVNALDPNEKEVYPSDSISESSPWLTYTIRFQNTGTASAINVRITDTLDNNLDPSTFQLLAYSAKNLTQIFGNDVVFNFPNINLPDSATSDSASRGYVQYKIKLKANLPVGTQIQNTADIYFDLNPAVVTNTTTNTITLPNGIAPVIDELTMQLYPNPAKDYVIVETGQSAIGGLLQVTDVTGREVAKFQISSFRFQIPTTAFSSGVYFVKVSNSNGQSAVRKLVIE